MNYAKRETWLACAINHLGKRKGALPFQWAETQQQRKAKISGRWVVYLFPGIKFDLEKNIVIPAVFIYDYWSHLFSVAHKYIICRNILALKNYLLLFIFTVQREHEAEL